jgi:hypothetical protein
MVLAQQRTTATTALRTNRIPVVQPNLRYRVLGVDTATRRTISTNVVTGSEAMKVRPATGTTTNAATRRPSTIRILAPESVEATQPSVLSAAKAPMPSLILVPDASKDTDTIVELFVYAENVPLRWNTNLNAYACPLVVGVDVSDGQGSPALPTPLTFQLLAENCSLAPTRVTITNAGTAGSQTVTLTCEDPRVEPTIFAFYDPSAPRKPLKVPCMRELGDILLEAKQASIFGYGLGTTEISITRLARDRYELFDAQDLNVGVRATRGILGHISGITSNKCSATIEFRSIGIGPATISARVGPFTDSQEIQFTFPLSLIIATILGGALGGCGRTFRHRELAKHRYRIIIEGALCGVLIVAAVATGIVVFTLPPGIVASELGAFVIAGISGYTGSHVLDRLKAVTRPQAQPAEA